MAAPKPTAAIDPYLSAWSRLRRVRIATACLLWSWLFLFPGGLLFVGPSAMLVLLPLLLLALHWTFSVSFFPCPRCDDWFKSYPGNPFADHCAHCGTKIGAEDPTR